MAQFGRALRSGRRGPRFKSGRPDCFGPTTAESWRSFGLWSRRIIGIAPVSKTGAREGVWVRIPPAPLRKDGILHLACGLRGKGRNLMVTRAVTRRVQTEALCHSAMGEESAYSKKAPQAKDLEGKERSQWD